MTGTTGTVRKLSRCEGFFYLYPLRHFQSVIVTWEIDSDSEEFDAVTEEQQGDMRNGTGDARLV